MAFFTKASFDPLGVQEKWCDYRAPLFSTGLKRHTSINANDGASTRHLVKSPIRLGDFTDYFQFT